MYQRKPNWKPAKLDDGSKIDGFKLMKIVAAARDDLLAADEHDAAHYFDMMLTWLQEDVFGKGMPFEYSNRVLNL